MATVNTQGSIRPFVFPMTLPEGKAHQSHCDLPIDAMLMTTPDTRSFLDQVKHHCAVDVQ